MGFSSNKKTDPPSLRLPFPFDTLFLVPDGHEAFSSYSPSPPSSPSWPPSESASNSEMMHMTLYWGTHVTLLFDFWSTDSWLSYGVTLIACFLFAAFYQYMEDRRLRLRSLTSPATRPPIGSADYAAAAPLLRKAGRAGAARLGSAALFGVNAMIGYLLMLAIMSFNGGVLLAVVLGLTVGYFVFRFEDEEVIQVVEGNSCACA